MRNTPSVEFCFWLSLSFTILLLDFIIIKDSAEHKLLFTVSKHMT